MRKLITLAGLLLALATIPTACIEDGVTTSPAHQPAFSADTLKMGTFFTTDPTPTFSLVVYNRHDKVLNISSIGLRANAGADADAGIFRLNVDGRSGTSFSDIEIRPNDSIFVFVAATLPEAGAPQPAETTQYLDFVTNGQTRSVVLQAFGQDVDRRRAMVVDTDTRLAAGLPYQIFDSLVVAPGATLTLEAGVKLHFHDSSVLKVRGTLVTEGTPEAPVEMMGDRTDNVVGSIPFDLMASQWQGVYFYPTSTANSLSHTVIRNTEWGVVADSLAPGGPAPGLRMVNCRLRNSAGLALQAWHTDIEAYGCEIADASAGCMLLYGGSGVFNHCTFANYYLFTAIAGPAIQMGHLLPADAPAAPEAPLLRADFTNCIVYGLADCLSHGDLTDTAVTFRRCLFKSPGENDDHFIDCLWDTDPLYLTVREEYIFDYRLAEGSPALQAANPALTLPAAAADYYGITRLPSPSLGAYQ